jgi:hypothetical protein
MTCGSAASGCSAEFESTISLPANNSRSALESTGGGRTSSRTAGAQAAGGDRHYEHACTARLRRLDHDDWLSPNCRVESYWPEFPGCAGLTNHSL